MFARMASLPDVGSWADRDTPSGDLALQWIELQNSQSIVARRKRLNCPPFQASTGSSTSSSSTTNSSTHQHAAGHRMLAVCRAGRNLRQTSKRGSPSQHFLRHQAMVKVHHNPQPARGVQRQSPSSPDSNPTMLQQACHHHQHQPHTPPQAATPGSSHSSSTLDPQQLTACIQAASSFSQLQAVCNTFLGHAAFTPQHAALVLARLHLVASRPADSQLLLVELLAQLLPEGCTNPHTAGIRLGADHPGGTHHKQEQEQQAAAGCRHLLSCGEVAAVCWAFARAGYQPAPHLLQQLLQQFWLAFGQQQQHHSAPAAAAQPAACSSSSTMQSQPNQQQQQQRSQQAAQWPPNDPDEALATLVAGLAGLGCREASCWGRVRAAVQVSLSDCSTRLPVHALQQLAWGFAAVQQADAETVDALAAALAGRLRELETPEDLVQSMWSLHLMGCTDGVLFEQAAQLMVAQLRAGGGGSAQPSASSSRRALVPTVAAAGAGVSRQGTPSKQQAVMLPQLPSSRQQGASSSSGPGGAGRSTGSSMQAGRLQQHGAAGAASSFLLTQRLTAPLQQQMQQRHQQRHQQQRGQEAGVSGPQRLLTAAAGQTAALCSAAASQAFGVLHKYDPLLCMLALYRDYYRPAHGVGSL